MSIEELLISKCCKELKCRDKECVSPVQDRLYGGYFSDWSCGGQWGHMVDFLATLVGTLQQSNVQMAIFFNGALEPERFAEWRARQLHLRNNVRQVLKHIHKRATPPPKAW